VILVVSLNPALDITHEVLSVGWAGVNRPHTVHARPGGKGVNVARTLRALGADVTLTGLAGGSAGSELRDGLAGSGIKLELTPIGGQTRRTFTVVDGTRRQAALFNEPGPAVGRGEFGEFFASYEKAVAECAVVVLAGSLPRGVEDGAYAELIKAAGPVPAILDTSGTALALGAAAVPTLVKPNVAELAAVAGRELPDLAAIEGAARELSGGAVVVSLGAEGLLAVNGDDVWLARPGGLAHGNPTGAGDAAVAGLADGLARGLDWPERLRRAVALGSATAGAPVAGEYAVADYDYHYKLVQIAAVKGSTSRWIRESTPENRGESGNPPSPIRRDDRGSAGGV
jgi:tagatose 6-phosphate kinase